MNSTVLCRTAEYLGKKASFFRILLCSVRSIPVEGTMWWGEHFSWQAFSQSAPTHGHTQRQSPDMYTMHAHVSRKYVHKHMHAYTQTHKHTHAHMHICTSPPPHTHAQTHRRKRYRICRKLIKNVRNTPNRPAGTTSACSPVSCTLNVS